MKCPLCEARKAKRFCPAKAEQICPVCCGTKREVEIDCPADCAYLHQGREYESERLIRRGQVAARTRRLWEERFLNEHQALFLDIWQVILDVRQRLPEMVDSDVQSTLDSLIETYETLDKGIYYDRLPDRTLQRNLYASLKQFFETSNKEFDVSSKRLKTSTILDCLQFQRELASSIVLPRPRSRAFLDHLQSLYSSSEAGVPEQSRIIMP